MALKMGEMMSWKYDARCCLQRIVFTTSYLSMVETKHTCILTNQTHEQ